MTAKMLRASPLSVVVCVVVAAVAIVGFVLTKNNAAQQDQTLLHGETAQAALIGSSEFGSVVSEITGLIGPAARYDPGSLQAIASAVASADKSAHFGVDVFRRTAAGFEAIAAAGPGPNTGELATGALGATLSEAQSSRASSPISVPYVPTPIVRSGTNSTVGFAQPVSSGSDEVVYFQFTLDPFTAAKSLLADRGPFGLLKLAVYGSSKPESSSVVVATDKNLPLTGTVAQAEFSVGTRTWLIVTQARSPLAGSFAAAAPWVILALGLFLALLLAGTIEILVRRQRYANHLVAERTEALEISLSDLRTAQAKLVQGERLAALGEMASVVGHELRNPLTAVTNALFLLRRTIGDSAGSGVEKHLDMAERETTKAATLAEDLTAFVRPRQPVMAELDLADVLHEVIEATPPPEEVELVVDTSPATIAADRGQLAEVLTNLVTNAYQAVPEGGSVRVSSGANGAGAIVVVQDSGPGIDPAVAERIFEPFFTTKSSGTGLGLAIVRRLVEAHGGEISIDKAPEHGTRVTVRLPVGEADAQTAADEANRRSGTDRRAGVSSRKAP
jgi:signal transduction histidine kinase